MVQGLLRIQESSHRSSRTTAGPARGCGDESRTIMAEVSVEIVRGERFGNPEAQWHGRKSVVRGSGFTRRDIAFSLVYG